jgi:hypothetical protein
LDLPKWIARQVFIRQTVHYWNTQYGLEINEGELTLAGSTSDDGHAEKKSGRGTI